jgi:hypothetical protein
VRSNHEPVGDQAQARREHKARRLLLDHGADRLDRRPWRPSPVPPSAVDLIEFFLWQSSDPDGVPREAAIAALRLFPAARAELEQLEAGLMFTARGLGLTWAEMARALGLNSPQACQQRLDRLTARSSRPADGQTT